MKDPTPDILRRLERYRVKAGLTENKLSVMVSGSSSIFKRLRSGKVTLSTLRKIDGWLDRAAERREAA